MPDAFIDLKRITKSHIPAENVPIRIDVPIGPSTSVIANESKVRLKHGRPLGPKDQNPRKRKNKCQDDTMKESHMEVQNLNNFDIHEGNNELETARDNELSINFRDAETNLNRSEIVIDYVSAYNVAIKVMQDNEDLEPQSVIECQKRNEWPKWQEAIQSELNSLAKREVFGRIVQTPNGIKSVGGKWIFVRKRNERNEIVRYKARLVAQGFSQRPGIDYEEAYSPVMDAITF